LHGIAMVERSSFQTAGHFGKSVGQQCVQLLAYGPGPAGGAAAGAGGEAAPAKLNDVRIKTPAVTCGGMLSHGPGTRARLDPAGGPDGAARSREATVPPGDDRRPAPAML
jgi:hypothetical protein